MAPRAITRPTISRPGEHAPEPASHRRDELVLRAPWPKSPAARSSRGGPLPGRAETSRGDPRPRCRRGCQLATDRPSNPLGYKNAEELVKKLHHAGAVFLGNYAPVALGDYAAGPSHVLPTSGTARFASGLSANDFLRASSVIHFDRDGMERLAPAVRVLATKEGLTAHRESVEIRLPK